MNLRITSLQKELALMRKCIEKKMLGFVASTKKISCFEEAIFRLFKGSSRVKIDDEEAVKIGKAIKKCLKAEEPIRVAFLWAVGGQARNPYKILQWDLNLPRLGDVWAIYWLAFLHCRAKHLHDPGLEIVIIDEGPLLKFIGWKEEEILRRRSVLQNLIPRDFPISIVGLPDFSTDKISISDPSLPETLSIVSSAEFLLNQIPEDKIEKFHHDLYLERDKNWQQIRDFVPDKTWQQALEIRTEMSRICQARKESGWVQDEIFSGKEYIDGAITEKGRWTPDIWSFTFPQHGGTWLVADGQTKYSTRIIPEQRLAKNASFRPVFLPLCQMSQEGKFPYEQLIFYWEKCSDAF